MSNGYTIILTNGTTLGGGSTQVLNISQVANSIADGTLTTLKLLRQGARNYAEVTSENMVRMLENFSYYESPQNPLTGQLWFNPASGSNGELMVYNTGGHWVPSGNPFASGLASAVNISISGAASGSAAFDGTSDITIPITLATVPGLAAGTYVSPTLTVDVYGRITSASGTSFNSTTINNALGYTAANDALVVHKSGDTMTGSLTVVNADVNTTGSGLIKENGNALIPSGFIGMWSGSSTNIPAGWHLCNGTGGTPDLRGRFVVCTGGDSGYVDGQTGGVDLQGITSSAAGSHSHVLNLAVAGSHYHTGTTDAHALSINEIPSHNHPFGTSQTNFSGNVTNYASGGDNAVYNNPVGGTTGTTGGGLGHTHPIQVDGSHTHTGTSDVAPNHTHTVSFDNRPEFYALAFIMKL